MLKHIIIILKIGISFRDVQQLIGIQFINIL